MTRGTRGRIRCAPQACAWIAGLALLLPAAALALAPPHDASNGISCDSCHAMHGGGMMGRSLLPRGAEQEALCKSCHNPTGQAAALSDVGSHVVGGRIVDCGSCHEPHGPMSATDPHAGGQTAQNLRLIRPNTRKYVGATALEPAIFQQRPGHFAFDEANPPWDGICQSCHTQTDHHRNDGSADHHHQIGLACTTCHPHDAGFAPQGGCSLCHDLPQGGRRQIVEHEGDGGGDFVRVSHHVQGQVQDSACAVCHYLGDHQSGTVKLKDPDQGAGQVYEYSPAAPAALEPFCLNCHDADGALAAGGTDPFADGSLVPDIDQGGLWAASSHASGGTTNSGYSCFGNGTTTGCHGNGHGSNLRKLLQPYTGAPGVDNVNEEEGFCYNCHGTAGVVNEAISNAWIGGLYRNFGDDIEEAFGLRSAHPVNDSAAGHVFDLGGGPQELECTSCHDVHRVTGTYWQAVGGATPVILPGAGELWGDDSSEKMSLYDPVRVYQSPYMGAPGVDLSGRPLPIDGSGNSLLTGAVVPDYVSMCVSCHQSPVGGAMAIDWPSSKHGSVAAEPNGPAGWPLWGPYVTASRGQYFLGCLDCHEGHGSANRWLIRRSVNGALVPNLMDENSTIEWLGVCDQCHGSNAQSRHHNNDVWVKLGMTPGNPNCIRCHFLHGSFSPYVACVSAGCHSHADFF